MFAATMSNSGSAAPLRLQFAPPERARMTRPLAADVARAAGIVVVLLLASLLVVAAALAALPKPATVAAASGHDPAAAVLRIPG